MYILSLFYVYLHPHPICLLQCFVAIYSVAGDQMTLVRNFPFPRQQAIQSVNQEADVLVPYCGCT